MIIGIESSCDESAISVLDTQNSTLTEWIHTQTDIHQAYGGVVPDLATDEHIKRFELLLGTLLPHIENKNIQHIAVTHGPGLAGCLAIGTSVAKSLALYYRVPLIGVNHLRGHAFSPFISLYLNSHQTFEHTFQNYLPHLGLIVSGGNTLLFRLDTSCDIQILAQTLDDAAGEALDKGAKLMNLLYPGGPHIEKLSQSGDPAAFAFPRSLSREPRFSFSGLKTSLRYQLQKMAPEAIQAQLTNLCASYQAAVIDQLVAKLANFLKDSDYKSVGLSGGVSNNRTLQEAVSQLAHKHALPLLIPEAKHTGDNASMIAFASLIDLKGCQIGDTTDPLNYSLSINPSLKLKNTI
jgi:N6-L-threonylcarbamoyladenine synthase